MSQINKIIKIGELKIYYNNHLNMRNEEKKDIVLLISHELSNTGAPIVLYYAAKTLMNNGFFPIIISRKDGDLRGKIVDSGIPVIIDKIINKYNFFIKSLINQSNLIIVNTVTLDNIINDLQECNNKIIWWLHEGETTYKIHEDEYISNKLRKNISVYAVSNIVEKAYENHSVNKVSGKLVYGIPDKCDFESIESKKNPKKIIFAIIGTILGRKAQDIFADAIEKLEKKYLDQAEFWIIGHVVEPEIQIYVEKKLSNIETVKWLGEKSVDEMHELYKNIDVIVCPSREDPLPVVMTEAMMYKKVCITSDMTGTAEYISDKENGLVCEAENANSLAEKIIWVIDNPDKMKDIGENARKLYETKFSMEVFKDNLLHIIKTINEK